MTMDTPTLLAHLRRHGAPLTLPPGAPLRWDDAQLHRAAHARDAERYALLALVPGAAPWQRARVLLQVLAASQAGLGDGARAVQARAARVLSLGLPPAHVVTVLLALRRLRANHKHTTRAALRFVLEHPGADALIAARRAALRDCFEHALGAAAARGCARRIAAGDTGSDYLRRRLLRFLTDPAAAPARVQALYRPGDPAAPPPDMPGEPALPLDRPLDRPGALPRFAGTVALVLDAPAPGRARPEEAALRAALARVCDRLEVIETGAGGPAAAVTAALAAGPDLVAVLTRGPGGPHAATAFPAAAPVVFCRAPAPHGPRRDDLAGPLPWLLGHCAAGAPWLHAALHARLDDLERRADALTARLAA
ncbi:hypothetical protein HUT06_20910 [Actinomadura sp. NAK00032]|uniref:hypothetical protein n=1 Tax=Actinomadura sp. NAK00032 TaxID=2742128 RepID=UPI0015929487|nr:hypothetical protein [Actinomadura sp. NAK00032]QKW36190.1 hypothetical protein HUT06_20910 [Actinomadura sp. NAK00032]